MNCPAKYCECGKRLRGNSNTYSIGTCTACLNWLPEFADLRRQLQSERFRRYYKRHKEKEKERSRVNYQKNKKRII